METKTIWDTLSQIDCANHIEEKNGLKYLSWAWAWGITKKNFPSANYALTLWDGKPYLFDEFLGYLVQTTVTINNESLCMQLPVMDGANKAQRHIPHSYQVAEWVNRQKTGKMIEKKIEAATMFDINTAIMRCLTKNLAMFGLGHYLYAGEDVPKQIESESEKDVKKIDAKAKEEELVLKICGEIEKATNRAEVLKIYNANKPLHTNDKLMEAVKTASIKYPAKTTEESKVNN